MPHLIRTNCCALSTCPWAGSRAVAVGQQHCVVEQHSLVFPLGMGLLSQVDLSACSQQCHKHLLQQQPGIGEMPFQIFLCKGIIYPGYPRGNPGYLLLLAPGEHTPGWEEFLTLWKKHPHHQTQIPQGKSSTVHRNVPEVQREGRYSTPA